jgi:hypothetical protein
MAVATETKEELVRSRDRAKGLIKRYQANQTRALQSGLRAVSGVGTALGLGYLEGAYEEQAQIGTMPVSLVVGFGATAAAILDVGGPYNAILEGMGIGAASGGAYKQGRDMAEEDAVEEKQQAAAA